MSSPRRGMLLTLFSIGLVIVAVAVIALLMVGREGRHSTIGTAPSSSPASLRRFPPPLDATRAGVLSRGLTSGTAAGIRSVFDTAAGQQLDPAAVVALHTLGRIDFNLASFHDNGDGTATVDATAPATGTQPARNWRILLVDASGQWLISQTDPL